MHDQPAVREEEGMSEGKGRKRERETHSSIFHVCSLQMNLMDQRESEREREGGELEFYLFYFFS